MQRGTEMVVYELSQVYELARKLSENLEPSKIEICRTVAREIICSIEKAISTAKTSGAGEAELVFPNGRGLHEQRLSQEFSDKEQKIFKKRKIHANRTSQVRVITEEGAGVPPDDGHSWRKYGQKEILRAKHPRSYYRCTYRKTQGCSAMKQVQKSDENPSILDITYLGTHTCSNSPQQNVQNSRFYNPQQSLLDQQNNVALDLDFQTTNFIVKTESSDMENQDPTTSSSFSSTSTEGMNPEKNLLCSSPRTECGYEGILSSALMSPTRYGSCGFPWPPCEMNGQADSILTEAICSANSVTGSQVMNIEYLLEYGEMDHDEFFDTSVFFV
ncbi:probable WRKY transcription factor 38 [Phalaenopsis equestris]|uniref:probable WRKY transcription factor 38 n=1 Tax=Phalaenopsis equestris TaxID=78828 RepID=UPI0009E3DF04|nr:probable WRKY transcription factor 38 [Phalaenopsis equestris]